MHPVTNTARDRTVLFALFFCLLAVSSVEPGRAEAQQKHVNSAISVTVTLPDVDAIDPLAAYGAEVKMNVAQCKIEESINALLRQPNVTPEAKTILYRMVGNWRVYESIELLINDIDFRDSQRVPPRAITSFSMSDTWSLPLFPAQDSLVSFGRDGTEDILNTISDVYPQIPFVSAHVDGYAKVLCDIVGNKCALLLLNDCKANASTTKVKQQCDEVIMEVNKANGVGSR